MFSNTATFTISQSCAPNVLRLIERKHKLYLKHILKVTLQTKHLQKYLNCSFLGENCNVHINQEPHLSLISVNGKKSEKE